MGIPRRVCVTVYFCRAFTSRIVPRMSRPGTTRGEEGPVASEGRANWPIPFGYLAAILAGSSSSFASKISDLASQMLNIDATFSSSVMRVSKSSPRASTGAPGSLYKGVEAAAAAGQRFDRERTTAMLQSLQRVDEVIVCFLIYTAGSMAF